MNSDIPTDIIGFRASLLHFLQDPTETDSNQSYVYHEDGLLLVWNGTIYAADSFQNLQPTLPPQTPIVDYSGRLILPGFIDTHIHLPQTDMIASVGKNLLDWLNTYTYPTEKRFENREYVLETTDFFLDELLRNGTTSAMILGTVHKDSVDRLFYGADAKNMRIIAGKIMMDRNAPAYLLDSPQSSYDDSLAIVEKWHNKKRLLYAVTPRFAPTSSQGQLEKASELIHAFPDLYFQTHLAETQRESDWVSTLFEGSQSYLDVYDRFHFLRPKALFAHAVHISEPDFMRLAETGAAISFCPSSNLFLGSGLFDLTTARRKGIRIGIGTDVGAGTSFSILKTLSDAYKVCQLGRHSLSPLMAFYLATLGGAEALYLDHYIGNFEPGKEADFVVLDLESSPILARRMQSVETIHDKLAALMILGDDRAIAATYVMGKEVYKKRDACGAPADMATR